MIQRLRNYVDGIPHLQQDVGVAVPQGLHVKLSSLETTGAAHAAETASYGRGGYVPEPSWEQVRRSIRRAEFREPMENEFLHPRRGHEGDPFAALLLRSTLRLDFVSFVLNFRDVPDLYARDASDAQPRGNHEQKEQFVLGILDALVVDRIQVARADAMLIGAVVLFAARAPRVPQSLFLQVGVEGRRVGREHVLHQQF